MKRKLLLVGIFVAVAVAFAFALYYVFFRGPVATLPGGTLPPTSTKPGGSLPSSLNSGIRQPSTTTETGLAPGTITTPPSPTNAKVTTVSTGSVLSPELSSDGKGLNYYNPNTGQFMRVNADGSVQALSDKIFYNVSSVEWSPRQTKAVLSYPDGSKILYDFDAAKQTTLPSHWQQFSFSPKTDQMAFMSIGGDSSSRWLAIANDNGSGARAIEPLGDNANKVLVSWSPNDQVIAFAGTPSTPGTFNDQEVLLVGKNGENFKSLHIDGINFVPNWSPDGNYLLYSTVGTADEYKPKLWITRGTPDAIGQGKTSIALNTWADKCSFQNATTVYCAVPTELPQGAGLLREIANTTPDNIYRIDLSTGSTTLVATPETPQTIDSLIIPADGNAVFFRNAQTGQLQEITLR